MIVAYLIKTYGPAKMDKVLGLFQTDTPLDSAMVQVYNLDTQGIDETWRASLGFGPGPNVGIPTAALTPTPVVIPTLVVWTAIISQPTEPSTPSPINTFSAPILMPALSSTPTLTLTPTLSATPSLTPTLPLTPTLTTTPPGFFNHNDAGFSVSYPSYWKVIQSDRYSLVIGMPDSYLYVVIEGRAEKEAQSMDEVITRLKNEMKAQSIMIGKTTSMDLPDQVKAQTVEVTAVFGLEEQDWRVIYTHLANRGYTLVEIAEQDGLQKEAGPLDQMLQNLHFFSPQPLGLPHDQTLVMAGSDPSPKDLDPLNFTSAARANPVHAVLYSWCADYPDPQDFLDLLFHSQSAYNVAQHSETDFDKLVEQAWVEKDVNRRLALYQQAETMLLDNVMTIPLYHPVFYTLVKPRVSGYVMTPLSINLFPVLQLVKGANY